MLLLPVDMGYTIVGIGVLISKVHLGCIGTVQTQVGEMGLEEFLSDGVGWFAGWTAEEGDILGRPQGAVFEGIVWWRWGIDRGLGNGRCPTANSYYKAAKQTYEEETL